MNIIGKKLLTKATISALGIGAISTITAGVVFAWPTRGPEIDCDHIHWEMQNDKSSTKEFTGHVTQPIDYTVTSHVAPSDWGILDKTFSNLTGNVTVSATISMGGDTRHTSKTLDCGEPTPSPSPTPTSSPSPSASPAPIPSPSPTPGVGGTVENNNNNTSESNNENKVEVKVENNATQTVNVESQVLGTSTVPVKQPETGAGLLGIATLATTAPFGFMLSRYGRGRVLRGKKEESLGKVASDIFDSRNSKLG
jgi:hypothetical protein